MADAVDSPSEVRAASLVLEAHQYCQHSSESQALQFKKSFRKVKLFFCSISPLEPARQAAPAGGPARRLRLLCPLSLHRRPPRRPHDHAQRLHGRHRGGQARRRRRRRRRGLRGREEEEEGEDREVGGCR